MSTSQREITGKAAARFLGQYAKRYAAGAFSVPTARDLDAVIDKGDLYWHDGVFLVRRRSRRPSTRHDFTGRAFTVWGNVVTHLAVEPDAVLPDLAGFDCVLSYVDDHHVRDQLIAQRREIHAVRVSAASELIGCWERAGWGHRYDPVDVATMVQIPVPHDIPEWHDVMLGELAGVTGWCDDYPFYSDGSWDAVSLRGFNPADPTWGAKPAEMSKAWHREHPEAANFTECGWTPLADKCSAMVTFVDMLNLGGQLERVRLLRMQGRGGKGGSLARHSDVTDRAAGTGNGYVARFHVPLVTDPRITMSAWNLRGERHDVHLPERTVWYLDARKPHAVDNRAGIDRVHLVIDVIVDETTRRRILEGTDVAA